MPSENAQSDSVRPEGVKRRPKRWPPGCRPTMASLLVRAAELMDKGLNAADIAAAMDVEIGTAKGYIVRARAQRGLTRKIHRVNGTLGERMAAKVDRNGPLPDHAPELGPCHLWIAGMYPRGYGMIQDTRGEIGPKGTMYKANRAAWMLAHGPIPDGMVIRHKCDRPRCANLAHLEIGTYQDNTNDMIARGRVGPRGLASCRCSLCHELGHRCTKCPKRSAA